VLSDGPVERFGLAMKTGTASNSRVTASCGPTRGCSSGYNGRSRLSGRRRVAVAMAVLAWVALLVAVVVSFRPTVPVIWATRRPSWNLASHARAG